MSEENVPSSEAVVSDSTPSVEASQTPESSEVVSDEVVESEGVEASSEGAEEAQPEQTFTIKVDGEDLELNYEQMVEFAQKGKGAVKKFQEAAALRKEVEAERAAIQAALQGKPEDLFEMKIKAGLMSGEDLERWIIEKAIALAEREELTPEQRKQKEMEEELERLRSEKQREEQERAEAAHRAEVARYTEDFSNQIISAIEEGGLDRDPVTVQKVATIMSNSIDETGQITVTVSDAVNYLKSQERNSFREYLSGLDEDTLERILGEEKLNKLRAKDLQKIKNPIAAPKNPFVKQESSSEKAKISATEFFKNL